MSADDETLGSVLDDLKTAGDGDSVSVGDVMAEFEHRSLGVLLVLLGLIACLPVIGAIPGVSITIGILVILAVAQSFFGRGGIWLPGFLREREISRDKIENGVEKARPWTDRIDKLVKPRLTMLSEGKANRWIVSLVAAMLAVTFFPAALLPAAVMVPAAGIVALGLGLIAHDGILVLLGYLLGGVTLYLVMQVV